jgi:hypothetical protein
MPSVTSVFSVVVQLSSCSVRLQPDLSKRTPPDNASLCLCVSVAMSVPVGVSLGFLGVRRGSALPKG